MVIQMLSLAVRLAAVLGVVSVFALAAILACLIVVPVAIGLFAVTLLKRTRDPHKEV